MCLLFAPRVEEEGRKGRKGVLWSNSLNCLTANDPNVNVNREKDGEGCGIEK